MHEFSIASHITGVVLKNVKRNNVKKVIKVVVEVGSFTMIIPSYLTYCYDIIKQNYPELKDSTISITSKPGKFQCLDCGAITEVNIDLPDENNNKLINPMMLNPDSFKCKECQSINTKIIAGREALVKSMIIDENC
ncbi:MAG: hydrogenase maturation nickel metallochaperone HypA/HybF [Promethearchaeota archaeon]